MSKSPAAETRFIEPMYAVASASYRRKNWQYEIKLDGYRCIAAHDSSGVKLWSRRGNLLTAQFPAIAQACQELPQGTVVDGEIVALDENGLTSFNLLQHHRSQASAIRYYLFDLLFDRGKSWLDVPLADRRAALAPRSAGACAILYRFRKPSTRRRAIDSVGESPRSRGHHRKAQRLPRTNQDGAAARGSNTRSTKARSLSSAATRRAIRFDAVIVGYYDGGKLLFASKVRAGFVPHVRRELMAKMKPLKTDACPFANLPEKRRTQWALTREQMKDCVWLKPELVAQIEFTEWTPDGHLRHAAFTGLRQDKTAREVVREPG